MYVSNIVREILLSRGGSVNNTIADEVRKTIAFRDWEVTVIY